MLPTSNYQFRILGGGHLWLPTHVPQGFHKDDRATWPPNAFLLPHDLEPEEKLAFLRQRLERKEFVEYCTIELLPDKWPEDIREEAAAVLAITRATTCFVDSESAPADAATPAFDPHGPPENFAPNAKSAPNRKATTSKPTATSKDPGPDPSDDAHAKKIAERRQRTELARVRREAALKKGRETAAKIKQTHGEAPLFELPQPEPPSLPPALAELRARALEKGPASKLPLGPQDVDGNFAVDARFTGPAAREYNFLLWNQALTPKLENRRGNWLQVLLQREPGNALRDCCADELERRHVKIVAWLIEYYIVHVPKWVAALRKAKELNAEKPPAAPGLEFPALNADFSLRWDPCGNAAQAFECSETQLNRICRNLTGQNARELWDSTRIKIGGVEALLEHELRMLRNQGYDGGNDETGADAARKDIKRGRRKSGRTRATVAQRLGFLNNARLDRGFMNSRYCSLSEFEAQACERLGKEGTLAEQLDAKFDALARELPPSTLGTPHKEEPAPASYSARMVHPLCRDFKNLLAEAFAVKARATWYGRRRKKLTPLVAELPDSRETGTHLGNAGANSGTEGRVNSAHTGEAAPELARNPNSNKYTPEQVERLRELYWNELKDAQREWTALSGEFNELVLDYIPLPDYSLPPAPKKPAEPAPPKPIGTAA